MSKERSKKIKVIYLDTNVILDFVLKRNTEAALLIESVKSRKWSIMTSTLAIIEMADWKKRDLFMRNKLELNWGMDTIVSQRNRTDLGPYEFQKVEKWLLDCGAIIKLDFRDLAGPAWEKVREISSNTNLLAKDALHFGTALVAALNNQCDVLVTGDGDFEKEAKKYLTKNRLKQRLTILTLKNFVKTFPAL